MKIGIVPRLDPRRAHDDWFEIEWPDGWRIPVRGEYLLLDEGDYVVESVQWELCGAAPAVQLRVSRE